MKRFEVRLFAAFREAAGADTLALESLAATPAELFGELCGHYPGLQRESAALVAVNETLADWNAELQDGDQVLFFPPVAGG